MRIGPYTLSGRLILAPMAGVTDRPFRQMCKRLGAAMAVSEMVTSDERLWDTQKSRLRRDHAGEVEPISVQILGTDPEKMAQAARLNVANGAQIIDINMGCPAKKVCSVAAGSALMRDEPLVGRILSSVVSAVDVPVTLKIRTGWSPSERNAVRIARIAQEAGIAALAVHGRTRACGYKGEAEYDTIAAVKAQVSIPIIANGDIGHPEKAQQVLALTGADALMIGRAAQGRPWIFREINHFLQTGELLPEPDVHEVGSLLLEHVENLHAFYGEYMGVRIARKHIAWFSAAQPNAAEFRSQVVREESAQKQLELIRQFFMRKELNKGVAA
ncbi:MAG: tRNA dihydrouridine synthase DusB [Gammaproteobacteria bacterium]|nr:tRNA dihydrouridine synthase DusB [Gammaproteobacteria bacterium]